MALIVKLHHEWALLINTLEVIDDADLFSVVHLFVVLEELDDHTLKYSLLAFFAVWYLRLSLFFLCHLFITLERNVVQYLFEDL